MKLKITATLLFLITLVQTSFGNDTLKDGFTIGTPVLKSIQAITFGPKNILFIGDNTGSMVYAIEINDRRSTSKINFNINNMESDKEIISRLKFISKIQTGEKIDVKYMFVQPEGIVTKFSRTFIHKCSRRNTLNFVMNTIKRTFEIITSYIESPNKSRHHICKNIIQDLKFSQKGIVNIKSTYLDDLKVCCDLDTLLQEIEAFLITINNQDTQDTLNNGNTSNTDDKNNTNKLKT